MENLQQVVYWQNQVEKYQGQALVPPRILGRRVIRTEGVPFDIAAVGPDYRAWVTDAGRHIPLPPLPPTSDAVAIREQNQRLRLRADVIKVALRKDQQDAENFERDVSRVRKWEERRANYPIPITATANIQEARVRIQLRVAEIQARQDAIEAENRDPAEVQREDFRRETLMQGMLEDAARFHDQQNFVECFDRCWEVLGLSKSSFLRARAHAILGMIEGPQSREHLETAISIYRSREAQEAPGFWRVFIKESQDILDKIDQKEQNEVRLAFESEQTRIDDAVKAANINDVQTSAGLCSALLQSKFTTIRAQAHLMMARLDRTPDKMRHASEALSRFQKLNQADPADGRWGEFIAAATWILSPPPPWVITSLEEQQQFQYLNTAAVLMQRQLDPPDLLNALKIYLTFVTSEFLSIRAECHMRLSMMTIAGDALYRRLQAYQALSDFRMLRRRDRGDIRWPRLVEIVHDILGGANQIDWERDTAVSMRHMTSDQVLLNSLGQLALGG